MTGKLSSFIAETTVQIWQSGLIVGRASWLNNFNNDSNFNANDRNVNNQNRVRGIVRNFAETIIFMRDLWQGLCSEKNLESAYRQARKHKTLGPYVLEFEDNLFNKLSLLRIELLLHSYRPKPLKTFILRDPKIRKISKSNFRDRIVHHALCNIIEPIFNRTFIYDSYANRKGKGTLKAINRFEFFANKLSHNYTKPIFVLKCDIKHYFENVNKQILIRIIQRQIKDPKVIWLIKIILRNYYSQKYNCGMPLGNLTSQFFANVYLNELDQFVKRELKAKYYIRYVDDFVIFHSSKDVLENWQSMINSFLYNHLALELHPDKSKIIFLYRGVEFLGFKIFPKHRSMNRRNLRKFQRTSKEVYLQYDNKQIDYNQVYNFMEGWCAYAKHANTYKLRQRYLILFEEKFSHEISSKEINRGLPKRKKD